MTLPLPVEFTNIDLRRTWANVQTMPEPERTEEIARMSMAMRERRWLLDRRRTWLAQDDEPPTTTERV